jgi:hypothetical protein
MRDVFVLQERLLDAHENLCLQLQRPDHCRELLQDSYLQFACAQLDFLKIFQQLGFFGDDDTGANADEDALLQEVFRRLHADWMALFQAPSEAELAAAGSAMGKCGYIPQEMRDELMLTNSRMCLPQFTWERDTLQAWLDGPIHQRTYEGLMR